ncbi:MAG: YezD family protein [Actinomycetota bacterium]|nr:YezD family protein [Actinomycetota bacterium]
MSGEDGGRTARGVDRRHADTMRAVEEALGRIQYGSILITIHQGEVVGIETSTKVRLKPPK